MTSDTIEDDTFLNKNSAFLNQAPEHYIRKLHSSVLVLATLPVYKNFQLIPRDISYRSDSREIFHWKPFEPH